MIRKMMSVRHKWLGAFAFAIVAALVGSQTATASTTMRGEAISFSKVKKASKTKRATVRRAYKKRKYTKRRTLRKSVRRISKRRTLRRSARRISKRRTLRRSARRISKRRTLRRSSRRISKRRTLRRSSRRISKRRTARKSYRKRTYKRRVARKATKRRATGRARGSLMATLRSVKPKGLPLSLAAAVVTVESGWRVNARGSSGERGLMQLMPATARMMGARGNLYHPATNMRAGTKYLNWCYRRARRNVAVTIGCYNRGPGKMWQWSGNPITRRYVGKVRRYMARS